MRNQLVWCLGIVLLACLGCGGDSVKVVPVSGTVKLGNQPLANATIVFLPSESTDSKDAAPSSSGITNADGKFTLKTGGGRQGAVPGKHRVMITTVTDDGAGNEDNIYAKRKPEIVPARYNSNTTLTFEVPAEGTDAANFNLTR